MRGGGHEVIGQERTDDPMTSSKDHAASVGGLRARARQLSARVRHCDNLEAETERQAAISPPRGITRAPQHLPLR